MELFFALSGYLIGGILIRMFSQEFPPDLSRVFNFWQRRWWRTVPNYILFFLLMLLFHFFEEGIRGVPHGVAALSYLVFCQNMVNTGQFFFGVSWSLCVEEWFYFLSPLLMLFLTKVKMNSSHALIAVLVLLPLISAGFRTHFLLYGHNLESVRMLTMGRLDAISHGVLLSALVRYSTPTICRRRWLAMTGLLLLSVSVALYLKTSHGIITANLSLMLPSLGFACLLPWCEKMNMVKIPAVLCAAIQNLSLWSYSIYLCHIPILYLVYDAVGDSRRNILINFACRPVAGAFTITLSAFVYRFFESKMTRLRPRESVRAL